MQDEKLFAGLDTLSAYRQTIAEKLRIDDRAYREMGQVIDRSPELVARIQEHYRMLDEHRPLRPTLGNDMQIFYMRDRQTFTFLMFPELLDMAYQTARIIGEKFIAPYLTGKTLPEIMLSNQPIAAQHGYAIQEIVECREDFAIYRNYECADCYGMPNIGMKICAYEAGTAAGCFETPLGRPVEVRETKCCANGDDYCEFEVRVLDK